MGRKILQSHGRSGIIHIAIYQLYEALVPERLTCPLDTHRFKACGACEHPHAYRQTKAPHDSWPPHDSLMVVLPTELFFKVNIRIVDYKTRSTSLSKLSLWRLVHF